jgi:hypothetical protein
MSNIEVIYAIVASDLILGSQRIKAFIPTVINDKDMEDVLTSKKYKGEHRATSVDVVNIEEAYTVEADWLPINTSRMSAPMVKKGMVVFLFKFGDTNRYRWIEIGNQFDLKKKDKFTYILGNTDEDGLQTEDNCHILDVDLVDKKHIYIKTVKNDGEKVAYDIKLDLRNGILTYLDSNKNSLELNGDKSILKISINEEIEFNTKKFTINSDDIFINSKNIVFETTDWKIKASKMSIQTSSYEISGSSCKFNIPTNFGSKMTCNNNASIVGYGSPTAHGGTIA